MKHKQKRSPLLRFWNFLLLAVILGAMLFSTASRDAMRLIDTYRYPRRYAEYVSEASERFGVEENMIYAIIKAESGFRATVVSRAGAIGLMQVIPDTFLFDIREKIDMAESPSSVLFSARENILAGTYYYSYLRKHFGAEREALAAYNAGIGNVTRWLADPAYADLKGLIPDAIPIAETRAYIRACRRTRRITTTYTASRRSRTRATSSVRSNATLGRRSTARSIASIRVL